MKYLLFSVSILFLTACSRNHPSSQQAMANYDTIPGTFAHDRAFLKKYKDVIELGRPNSPARLLIVKDYQGRVMTSTASGDGGNSYGWINYALISSGQSKPHINPFGGEDRFWLGPEGGQFALFFKMGDPFDFDHWQTPSLIDTEPFDLVSSDSVQATFSKSAHLTNYHGFNFELTISRQIKLLEGDEIKQEFGVEPGNLQAVAFQSLNSIANAGDEPWNEITGLPSIWILGMFNPGDSTVIILPYEKSGKPEWVTDNYFGKIPDDRIVKTDSLLLLKGDGRHRGKVGIAPRIAKNIGGSYDAARHILTLVKYDLEKTAAYVNSKWEHQNAPFRGDAFNSYNDGPLADGSQLGPFYELESSSPARALLPGQILKHRHITLHLEGDENELNKIAEKTLGVSLKGLTERFTSNR